MTVMTNNFVELHRNNLKRLEEINLRLSDVSLQEKESRVREIVEAVKLNGDKAIAEFTKRFDAYDVDMNSESPFKIEIDQRNHPNFDSLSHELKEAILTAKERITKFHISEFNFLNLGQGWLIDGELGEKLGVKYKAINSIAAYVPGGQAPLISTVLMTVIPAKVAGVNRIVLLSPPPIATEILAVAEICGVNEIYAIGGAQAIAALSYGTESIKAVDKIVGPGNIYVSLAKKICFGTVGIDGIYGPSELAILADETAKADLIVSDLLSQLEHGSGLESVLLVSLSEELIPQVKVELEKQISELEAAGKTKEQIQTIRNSMDKWSALLFTDVMARACDLINTYAPEHLELHLGEVNSEKAQYLINNAAAIFIGSNSCESLGDYAAGPSHCLPTGRTAKFSSGLQCIDFMKRSSVIDFSKVNKSAKRFNELLTQVAILARAEKLEAHARAAEKRKMNS